MSFMQISVHLMSNLTIICPKGKKKKQLTIACKISRPWEAVTLDFMVWLMIFFFFLINEEKSYEGRFFSLLIRMDKKMGNPVWLMIGYMFMVLLLTGVLIDIKILQESKINFQPPSNRSNKLNNFSITLRVPPFVSYAFVESFETSCSIPTEQDKFYLVKYFPKQFEKTLVSDDVKHVPMFQVIL